TCDLNDKVQVSLHDLTGFEGRCDAILLSPDTSWVPPHGGEELAELRTRCTSLGLEPKDGGRFDLVVVGGGIAGTSAAITAARMGLQVALVQDRPVLGGNGSSEVRVWPQGHTNQERFPHVGDVVSELVRDHGPGHANAGDPHVFDDNRKLTLALAEPNLRLFLNQRVNAAESRDQRITAVTAQHTSSGQRTRITGTLFLDSTGDGVLGALVGADYEITETEHMGASNLWSVAATSKNEFQLRCECEDEGDPLSLAFDQSTSPAPFPRCPWAVDLSERDFPGRKTGAGTGNPLGKLGAWFWESGFDLDPIRDMERVRDLNLRAMYGAWDTLKNVDGLYPNHRLKWAAYIAGKRESRRLMGDVVLVGDDFRNLKPYPDAAFPCSWHLDLHFPEPAYHEDSDPFISECTKGEGFTYAGPYWAPYRALYSRNIKNLFMAGRNISVNHEALGAVRVMRTCGMMGEVVGKAASLCVLHSCDPRGVYADHLDGLIELLKVPGRARRASVDAAL
ncbi:MAG: FAD-dependent oxidoreductase, partial [Planctomycetota bacterium]|nr:FAD-dependent oxidoreductase [Planctomycetota bacterium]